MIDFSVQSLQISCHNYPPLWLWNIGLLADSEKRIQAFETKCLRKLLRISHLERKTNDWVQSKINFLVGPQKAILAAVKRQKLAWFRHVTYPGQSFQNHPSGHLGGWTSPWLAEEMLDGQHQRVDIPVQARTAHKGRLQKKRKKNWKRISAELSLMSSDDPVNQRDWTELNWTICSDEEYSMLDINLDKEMKSHDFFFSILCVKSLAGSNSRLIKGYYFSWSSA